VRGNPKETALRLRFLTLLLAVALVTTLAAAAAPMLASAPNVNETTMANARAPAAWTNDSVGMNDRATFARMSASRADPVPIVAFSSSISGQGMVYESLRGYTTSNDEINGTVYATNDGRAIYIYDQNALSSTTTARNGTAAWTSENTNGTATVSATAWSDDHYVRMSQLALKMPTFTADFVANGATARVTPWRTDQVAIAAVVTVEQLL